MPVTAKLSRHFYDKLGEQAANELVDWFNSVDFEYRTELRTLNDLNFARFDAKVEQRFAEQDVRFERRFAETDVKWERRFAQLDAKIEMLRSDLRGDLQSTVAGAETRLVGMITTTETRLTRWMFAFWTTTMATQMGVFYLMLRSR